MGRSGGSTGRRGAGGRPTDDEREGRGRTRANNGGGRVQRVSSLVRQAVAEILTLEVKDPRIAGVVVTDVEITGDLREAQIFYGFVGDAGARAEAAEGLASCTGYVRRELGQRVSLRVVPSVHFRIDTSLDYGARIEARLAELGLGAAARPQTGDDDMDDESDMKVGGGPFDAEEATEPGVRPRPSLPGTDADAADDDELPDGSLGSLDDPTPAVLGELFEDGDDDHTEPGRARTPGEGGAADSMESVPGDLDTETPDDVEPA